MKRFISCVMAISMVMMLMCACGSSKNSNDDVTVRVGSLKGPTSMGLVSLMKTNEENSGNYEFTMETAADALVASVVQGNIDIALVPANVASILYAKTDGGVSVIDINTLGVLYVVTGDGSITDINDLGGKTVYLVGKGTTPDLVFQYLLSAYGVEDVNIQYKSEATEVAAVLASDPDGIGVLPQPFATVATVQNQELGIALDLNEYWNGAEGVDGSKLVTGVTVVRNEFLKEHEGVVKQFMADHKESALSVSDVSQTALLVAEYGIIEKAPVAEKAIPFCNITYIDGEDMRTALNGYLGILSDMNPECIGGGLPGDEFYYISK